MFYKYAVGCLIFIGIVDILKKTPYNPIRRSENIAFRTLFIFLWADAFPIQHRSSYGEYAENLPGGQRFCCRIEYAQEDFILRFGQFHR